MSIHVWRSRAPGELGSQEPKSSREHSRGQGLKVRGCAGGWVRGAEIVGGRGWPSRWVSQMAMCRQLR